MTKILSLAKELNEIQRKKNFRNNLYRSRGLDNNTSRGIRNNNPGNIRISNQDWVGKVPNQQNTDRAFEQFTEFRYGVRALILLIRNFYQNNGLRTVQQIINRYAPPHENQTSEYVNFVARRLNVDANAALQLNKSLLRQLVQAIARMENGSECISDQQFEEGWNLLPENVRQSIAQGYYNSFTAPAPAEIIPLPIEENDINERDEGRSGSRQSSAFTETSHCPINPASDARTAHFSISEFHCNDGTPVPQNIRGNVQRLMEQLEVLRAELNAPITVNSGYRTPNYNRSIGGAARSQHLCGTAADITVSGHTPPQVKAAIERLISAGRMLQGGIGLYNTFVHYDIRGRADRWSGTGVSTGQTNQSGFYNEGNHYPYLSQGNQYTKAFTGLPAAPANLSSPSHIERIRMFGNFDYVPDPSTFNGDGIRITTPHWEHNNITSVEIPQLNGKRLYSDTGDLISRGRIRFNTRCQNQLIRLWQAWESAGLLQHILTYSGGFAARFMRGHRNTGPESLSNHAWGTAFDINAQWNGLGHEPAAMGSRGSVRELVTIANQHGFYWGGHFRNPDGMHFEIAEIQP